MAIDTAAALPDLHSQFAQLEASYAAALERHRLLVRNFTGDTAGDDVVDSGTKAAASEQDEAELRHLIDRRVQMERALERLVAGTYGVCEACTKPIPAERLEVFPDATTCVACKQKAERSGRR